MYKTKSGYNRLLILALLMGLMLFQPKADGSFETNLRLNSSAENDSVCFIEAKDFQNHLNSEFKNKETTPLSKKDLRRFKALDFFDINPNYRVVATFVHTPNEPVFEMPTTTERKPKYRKYGEVSFVLRSDTLKLNIYQNIGLTAKPGYENYLFLPFKDLTNGKESYGGGRYLDLRIPRDSTLILNFNLAYNPYCAYNHKYSCPIPPRENHMNILIPVGVKAFKGH